MGQLEEAIQSYKRALAIRSDLSEVHANLGQAFWEIGKFEEAIKSFRKALAIQPNDGKTHHSMGMALLDAGKHKEGLKHKRLGGGVIEFTSDGKDGFRILGGVTGEDTR